MPMAAASISALAAAARELAFRFVLKGKPREMGFGGLIKVSLADARKKANDARLLLSDGHDPLTRRQEEATRRASAEKLTAARAMTFDQCAYHRARSQLEK
jgi:hypothetical protein